MLHALWCIMADMHSGLQDDLMSAIHTFREHCIKADMLM